MRLERLASADGIDPVETVAGEVQRRQRVEVDMFPSSGGIDPVRLLSLILSTVSADMFSSSGGSVPFSV